MSYTQYLSNHRLTQLQLQQKHRNEKLTMRRNQKHIPFVEKQNFHLKISNNNYYITDVESQLFLTEVN